MWRQMKTCLSALPAGTSFTEANCMQCVRLIVNGIQVVENCPQTVHILLVQPVEEHAADGHVAISGVFLYWLDEKDMDGLRAIFDHLNTIYD